MSDNVRRHRDRVRERMFAERLKQYARPQPPVVRDLDAALAEMQRQEVERDLAAGFDRPWEL